MIINDYINVSDNRLIDGLIPVIKIIAEIGAKDLKLLVENSGSENVVFDFSGVKFATRSFTDEFFNLFLKDPKLNNYHVELINIPTDIKAMLDAVSRTQVRATTIPSDASETVFKDVNEFLRYLGTATL